MTKGTIPRLNIKEFMSKKKRGMACASPETRLRVATAGGYASHKKRGLAAADPETRHRVAKAGGNTRAQDIESLRQAAVIGGNVVKERYGKEYYSQISRLPRKK